MITNAKKEKLLKIRIAKERSIDRSIDRCSAPFVFSFSPKRRKPRKSYSCMLYRFRRSLSNNRIETLEEHVFRQVTNLLTLDLRGNPIKEIHGNTFHNLCKLRKL